MLCRILTQPSRLGAQACNTILLHPVLFSIAGPGIRHTGVAVDETDFQHAAKACPDYIVLIAGSVYLTVLHLPKSVRTSDNIRATCEDRSVRGTLRSTLTFVLVGRRWKGESGEFRLAVGKIPRRSWHCP